MLNNFSISYDPLSKETLLNPYPTYKKMREQAPIFWHERMQSWVLTRHDDCMYVLQNSNIFALDERRIGNKVSDLQQNLQSLDPPENGPLRNLMMRAFKSQEIEKIRLNVRAQILEIFEQQSVKSNFDWMKEVSAPLSLRLTCILLGVKEPDLEHYMEISEGIAHQMDSGLSPENYEPGEEARRKLNLLVDQWFNEKEDSGILPYIRAHSERAKVPSYYIRNTTGTMFNASFGTLYATFGNVLLALLENPETLEKFKDSQLLDSGVDELIRYDGPAQGTSRFAVEDTMIRGVEVKKGDIVLTLLAAANRDPEAFPDPDKLILDRVNNKHLGFGWGPHTCVGSLFGKLAIKELIHGLLSSEKSLKLSYTPTRRNTATVRCIDVLPVSFNY